MKILFVGDIMQHQPQIDYYSEAGYDLISYMNCFSEVIDIFKNVDIRIGNLETTFAGQPYQGFPTFSAPDGFVFWLKKLGFNILVTANNHAADHGIDGILRTSNIVRDQKIATIGTATERGLERFLNTKIADTGEFFQLYAATDISNNEVDRKYLSTTDSPIIPRPSPDNLSIAYLHAGIEYKRTPSLEQIKLFDKYASKGYNLLIGSHPHVVEPIYKSGNDLRAYSLGNFISCQGLKQPQGSVILVVDVVGKSIKGVEAIATCSYNFPEGNTKIFTDRSKLNDLDGNDKNSIINCLDDIHSVLMRGDVK